MKEPETMEINMLKEKFEWPKLDVLELSDDIILTSGANPESSGRGGWRWL